MSGGRCLHTGGHAQLGEDVADMDAGRLLADEEGIGDLLVRPAHRHQAQDFKLPRGKTGGPGCYVEATDKVGGATSGTVPMSAALSALFRAGVRIASKPWTGTLLAGRLLRGGERRERRKSVPLRLGEVRVGECKRCSPRSRFAPFDNSRRKFGEREGFVPGFLHALTCCCHRVSRSRHIA